MINFKLQAASLLMFAAMLAGCGHHNESQPTTSSNDSSEDVTVSKLSKQQKDLCEAMEVPQKKQNEFHAKLNAASNPIVARDIQKEEPNFEQDWRTSLLGVMKDGHFENWIGHLDVDAAPSKSGQRVIITLSFLCQATGFGYAPRPVIVGNRAPAEGDNIYGNSLEPPSDFGPLLDSPFGKLLSSIPSNTLVLASGNMACTPARGCPERSGGITHNSSYMDFYGTIEAIKRLPK